MSPHVKSHHLHIQYIHACSSYPYAHHYANCCTRRVTLRWIKTEDIIVTSYPLGHQYTPHLHIWQSYSLAASGKKLLFFLIYLNTVEEKGKGKLTFIQSQKRFYILYSKTPLYTKGRAGDHTYISTTEIVRNNRLSTVSDGTVALLN